MNLLIAFVSVPQTVRDKINMKLFFA